jgi:TPP-dependent pyruvate/acetoin dehydrogenase alpha subunit
MHQVIETGDFEDVATSRETAIALYRDIRRARMFDERAINLQRRGWMSSYPPFRGQEASQVGAAHALREHDWLFPTYRSIGMLIARGVPMSDLLLVRRGRRGLLTTLILRASREDQRASHHGGEGEGKPLLQAAAGAHVPLSGPS